ncbi:Uncharacterised protein [Staphylococcus aureus]|nr:Uncharacterised protein [Staphylococcus aureus]
MLTSIVGLVVSPMTPLAALTALSYACLLAGVASV